MEQKLLQPFSSQWSYVNFRLQLLLARPNIQIISITKRTPNFAQTYESFLKIDGAVDITEVDNPTISNIKNSLKKDLIIRAGRLTQTKDNEHPEDQKSYRVILMKIAILQIYPTMKEHSLGSQDFLSHHQQFDSVYLSPRQPQIAIFNHEYLVKDPQQYQWEYDVVYSYKPLKQWKAEDIICQNCKLVAAKLYCLEDKQSFCQQCFGDMHRTDKKSKHKKQNISPYNCPPKCQKSLHQNQSLTHYCCNCKQLKCLFCLKDGQHQKDNKQFNENESIHEVLQSRQLAQLFRSQQININGEVKDKITSLIRQVEAKIQQISTHYDMRVKDFVSWFEQKTAAVKQWAVTQLNLVTGLHSQLKRKYDEVIWLQNFSQEMEQTSPADLGMEIKQGIFLYITKSFSQQYFQRLDKRVKQIKIFN